MNISRKNLPDLARICADITGDGHLQIQDWRHLTSFYSNNKKQINKIRRRFKKIFNIDGKIYIIKRLHLQYRFFIISKEIAEFLKDAGVPAGKKTDIEFLVPDWIYHGKPELKMSYLQGIFSCEGSIYSSKNKNGSTRWRICLIMYKNEKLISNGRAFMTQIRTMLTEFNIKVSPVHFGNTTTRQNGTKSRGLKFEIEAGEFEKFYKEIGFDEDDKNNKLRRAIAQARYGR